MKNSNYFFLIVLFFCCFTKHLYGQKTNKKYTISGYVKELGSQEDLPMVSVFIPNKNLGTSTNDYGFYSLTLPEGEYELVISYVGYTNQKKTVKLQENLKAILEIIIVEDIIVIKEVEEEDDLPLLEEEDIRKVIIEIATEDEVIHQEDHQEEEVMVIKHQIKE